MQLRVYACPLCRRPFSFNLADLRHLWLHFWYPGNF